MNGRKIDLPHNRHVALFPYVDNDDTWVVECRNGEDITRTRLSAEAIDALIALWMHTDKFQRFELEDGGSVWRRVLEPVTE